MSYAEAISKQMLDATIVSYGTKRILRALIENLRDAEADKQLKKDLENALKNYENAGLL